MQSLRKVFVIEAGALEALQAYGKEVSDEEFWERKNDAHGDDLATIVYTSGSTGTPKGVELSHRNLAFLCLSAMQYMPRACAWPDRRLLLFLPLSHVFARFMELLSFCGTLTLGLSSDMKTIVKDFESFGPTLLLAVPRVFEKVYNAASQRAGKGIAGKMFLRAADVARDWSKAEQAGEKLPWRGRLAHGFYELVVYKKIRTIFGPNADFAITGGAPMDANLSHFFNGIGMGLSVLVILTCCNVVISLIRKVIPNDIRLAIFVLVIAGFVTIVDLLLQAYVPALSASLGVFIPLIVVNCIIIGRAEAFCQKNPVGPSFFDGIFQGLGYTLVLIAMCVIRELLGKGSFGTGIFNTIGGVIGTGNGIQIFPSEYGALVLTLPIGGFITLGCLIALMQYALRKSAEKKEAKEKALAAQEKEAA